MIGSVTVLSQNADGLWVPQSPEKLLETSQTVFVGIVTSIIPVEVEYQSSRTQDGTVKETVGPETMILEEYTINVEEFLKNTQESNTMKLLQATVGGVPSGPAKISGFEIGDRVLFYVPEKGTHTDFETQYSPESFKIPKQCNAKSVLEQPRIDLKNSFDVLQDGMAKDDNFTARIPMNFVYSKDLDTLYGGSIDVIVSIRKEGSKQVLFEKNIHSESEPCQWITSATWEFIPEEGNYKMYLNIKENEESGGYASYTGFSVISKPETSISPLKQFNSGITFEDLKCKTGLEHTIKINDFKRFYCTSPDTKQILIKRGWAFDESKACRNPIDCFDSGISIDKTVYPVPESNSEINRSCMTLEQSKDIAPFFKVPSYLPEGYSMKCTMSGMPYESYIIYHNKDVSGGWMSNLPMLIGDGAIFIYQYEEKHRKEYETYGSPEQRIQETYDDVMVKNPSLQPQLIRINGMLAYAVDSCPDCGMQTANFTDGTVIQKSTSTETKIKFIDENGIKYMLKTTLPLDELIKVAESLG